MKGFLHFFFIQTPLGLLSAIFSIMIFGLAFIVLIKPVITETDMYGYLDRWYDEPELKADIDAAWNDNFVSEAEYEVIRNKHNKLGEIRERAKFSKNMQSRWKEAVTD